MYRKKLTSATVLVALALLLALPAASVPVVHAESYLIMSTTVDRTVVQEGDVLTVTINITCPAERIDFSFIESRLPVGFQFLNIESSRVYHNYSKTWSDQVTKWYDPLLIQLEASPDMDSYVGLGFSPLVILFQGDQFVVTYKLRANIPGTYQLPLSIIGYAEIQQSPIIVIVQPRLISRGVELTNLLFSAVVAAAVAAAISLAGIFWFRRTVLRRPVAKSAG